MKENIEENKKVLFIVGCGRSGTTMLGSMLGSAPYSIVTPESQFITEVAQYIKRIAEPINSLDIKKNFLNNFRFNLWNINDAFEKRIKPEIVYRQNQDKYLANIIWSCVELYSLSTQNRRWSVWVDHTPSHIKYIEYLKYIFPNAYFIHLIRDGRAVFSSVKPLDWGPNNVIKGAKWWAYWLSFGLAAEHKYPNDVLRLYYEDLVKNPDKEVQRICKFADISYDNSMLKAKGFHLPKYTKNQHKLVGKPISLETISKWEKKLQKREIEIFENIAGGLLDYLGYTLQYGLKARSANRVERYCDNFLDLIYIKPRKFLRRHLRKYFK